MDFAPVVTEIGEPHVIDHNQDDVGPLGGISGNTGKQYGDKGQKMAFHGKRPPLFCSLRFRGSNARAWLMHHPEAWCVGYMDLPVNDLERE